MTPNNFQRMKIVLDMIDPFDYDEFLAICETEKVQPLSINEYAMKVGYVMIAMNRYPDFPMEEAYLKVVDDVNNAQGEASKGCCGQKEDKALPSLGTEIKNLAGAITDYAMSGFVATDDIDLEKRLNICNTCDNMRSDNRCSRCGCYMKIKAKWASARCPDNLWEV